MMSRCISSALGLVGSSADLSKEAQEVNILCSLYKCVCVCSGHTRIPLPLFCQVGCQNLTGVSTSLCLVHVVS